MAGNAQSPLYDRLRAELESGRNVGGAWLDEDAEALLDRIEQVERWISRMPDAGFNDEDPRWKWWHERP